MDVDEVERLLAEYRRNGDRRARNRVVEQHTQVANFTVRRLSRGDAGLAEDMRQVALMAIVHAADRYRPGKGASFRTFATRTIDGELKRHLRDKTWAVRPPRSRQEHYLKVCRAREELTQELGRGPTTSEIADRTDLVVDEVLHAIEAGGARGAKALEPARDDDVMPTRPELAQTDRAFDAFEAASDLNDAFSVLDERERTVLHLRFVDELSQPDIAGRLDLSQSYVSRLLRGALAKLRSEMDANRFAPTPEHAEIRRTA